MMNTMGSNMEVTEESLKLECNNDNSMADDNSILIITF